MELDNYAHNVHQLHEQANGAESDAAGVNLPTVFKFKEHSVRTVDLNGEIWFVAADVCKALGLDNTTKALLPLDDETALTRIQGIPGKGEVNLVSESGLYNVIFTSRNGGQRRHHSTTA
jgi:prophage antirepressor-like protein